MAQKAAAAAELSAALGSPWLGEAPEVARSALAPHRYMGAQETQMQPRSHHHRRPLFTPDEFWGI